MLRFPAPVGTLLLLISLLGLTHGRIFGDNTPSDDSAHIPVNHHATIRRINAELRPSWVAKPQPRFEGMTLAQARDLCGFRPLPLDHEAYTTAAMVHAGLDRHKPAREIPVMEDDDIPATFDSREQWASCAGVIGHIRDQSNCGSCWAFASTEAFNDRLCIAKNVTEILSAQQTASCCNLWHLCLSFGCKGGNPWFAWLFFLTNGLVTGGDYGSTGTCYPYEIAPCHNKSDPHCADAAKTPKCADKTGCPDASYTTPWAKDIHRSTAFPKMLHGQNTTEEIQKAILAGGSVTGAFIVYSDFLLYSSGVYHHVDGHKLGGHAVKIIGWGEESGVPYWLVVNSWGNAWGLQGLFKIKRGNDECGIESTQISFAELE